MSVSSVSQTKEARMVAAGRCDKCWFPKTTHCICAVLSRINFNLDVSFLVYIHCTEWFNAGDDAKLLRILAPANTSFFVHGRPDDEANIVRAMMNTHRKTLILFPDEDAMDIAEYLESIRFPSNKQPLQLVVLDSTWRRARKMKRHLESLVNTIQKVKLHTEQLSIYKRTQSMSGRISTIEALALLLRVCGEDANNCDKLINAVRLNNDGLRHKLVQKKTRILWTTNNMPKSEISDEYLHPAWYFQRQVNGKRRVRYL